MVVVEVVFVVLQVVLVVVTVELVVPERLSFIDSLILQKDLFII